MIIFFMLIFLKVNCFIRGRILLLIMLLLVRIMILGIISVRLKIFKEIEKFKFIFYGINCSLLIYNIVLKFMY